MKIGVRVKPNAHKNEVTRLDGNRYLVSVTAPPSGGKANSKLIELLSDYFDMPKSRITIVKGAGVREKVVEII
ncbi:MAG: DUF167 domain-containing protein [Ignavibacteria bacterium]|nr:MAG: DUF167 domain-containing protein [Ignavibacteria bacterium]